MAIARLRILTRVFVVLTLAGALLAGVAPAEAQPSATSAWTPTTLTNLPHGPDAGYLDTVSCPAVGSCVALGSSDKLGQVVETLAHGGWTTTMLKPPNGATGISLASVSCSTRLYCDAVGVSQPGSVPLLERLRNGAWVHSSPAVTGGFRGISCVTAEVCTAIGVVKSARYPYNGTAIYAYAVTGSTVTQQQLPVPADVTDVGSLELDQISCPTTTVCTAVGNTYDAANRNVVNPFAETLSGGSWTVRDLPSVDGAGHDMVSSVSCPDVTTCYAIGQKLSSSGPRSGTSYAMKLVGATSTTTELGHDVQLSTVSCGDDTHCVAFGTTNPADSDGPRLVASAVLSGGTWTRQVRALPPGSDADYVFVSGIDCADPTFCVSVGKVESEDYGYRGRFLTETFYNGAWSVSEADAIPGPGNGGAAAVSCRSITACVVVGAEIDTANRTHPMVEVLAGGAWTRSTLGSPTDSVQASLDEVSCVTATACTAVGSYVTGDGRQGLLSETLAGATWTVHRIGLGFASGYQENLTGIDCFTATSCVAVGYHLDSPSGALRPFAAVLSGTGWARTRLPGVGEVDAISCQSVTSCVAVGGHDRNFNTTPVAWTLSGSTWTAQSLPFAQGAYGRLRGVSCVAATSCTAVGYQVIEVLSGGTWNVTTTTNAFLSSVSCVTATSCTAVGTEDFRPAVSVHTASGWSSERLSQPKFAQQSAILLGVQCFAETSCLAVGDAESHFSPDIGLPLIEQRS